jgi:mono/diheme cytochrome c family protein
VKRVLLLAVVLALGACKGMKGEVPSRRDGERLFAAVCAKCHGEEGRGGIATDGGPPPRNFHDATFHATHTDAQLVDTIIKGKNNFMPAFGATFTDAQMQAIVAHIRTFDPRGR